MLMNNNGEYEFELRNRQLLTVFFIATLLSGGFVTLGYMAGKNSVLAKANVQERAEKPLVVEPVSPPEHVSASAKDSALPKEIARSSAAPGLPAPSPSKEQKADATPNPKPGKSDEVKESERKPETSVAPSERGENEKALAESSDQPAPGQSYLQLKATSKSEADAMVIALRKKGFQSLAVEIQEKPGVWRVLTGPIRNGGTNALRADLLKDGFPGDVALPRTY